LAQAAKITNGGAVGGYSSNDHTLDGYAFDCGGLLIGFQGMDQIVCLTGGSEVVCGTYAYEEATSALTGHTSLTGTFLAFSLEIHDSILVSFRSDLGNSCHAVTLDWRKYSALSYMGLSCPEQNEIHPDFNNNHHRDHSLLLAYESNHFSLGVSGDVALRSPLLFSSGRRLVRDSYGIYKYHAATESIRLYFGQQGQLHQGATLILNGRLTKEGDLFLPAHVPSGQPCRHDGQSLILNVTELPSTANVDWVMSTSRSGHGNRKRISRQRVMDEDASFAMTMATERIIYWILISISFVGLGVMARR
jgi:hypothetical protein